MKDRTDLFVLGSGAPLPDEEYEILTAIPIGTAIGESTAFSLSRDLDRKVVICGTRAEKVTVPFNLERESERTKTLIYNRRFIFDVSSSDDAE